MLPVAARGYNVLPTQDAKCEGFTPEESWSVFNPGASSRGDGSEDGIGDAFCGCSRGGWYSV